MPVERVTSCIRDLHFVLRLEANTWRKTVGANFMNSVKIAIQKQRWLKNEKHATANDAKDVVFTGHFEMGILDLMKNKEDNKDE